MKRCPKSNKSPNLVTLLVKPQFSFRFNESSPRMERREYFRCSFEFRERTKNILLQFWFSSSTFPWKGSLWYANVIQIGNNKAVKHFYNTDWRTMMWHINQMFNSLNIWLSWCRFLRCKWRCYDENLLIKKYFWFHCETKPGSWDEKCISLFSSSLLTALITFQFDLKL